MGDQNLSKFLVFYQDVNYDDVFTPELIAEITQNHVDYLRDLDTKGVLFMCGLLKGTEEGMLMLNAQTWEEAESIVLKDPMIVNKGYKRYVIQEIVEANAGNNYLLDAHAME